MYFSKIFYKKGLALPAKNTHGMHQRWRTTYRSRLLIVQWICQRWKRLIWLMNRIKKFKEFCRKRTPRTQRSQQNLLFKPSEICKQLKKAWKIFIKDWQGFFANYFLCFVWTAITTKNTSNAKRSSIFLIGKDKTRMECLALKWSSIHLYIGTYKIETAKTKSEWFSNQCINGVTQTELV